MAAIMEMTVNSYDVEWTDDDANIACSIGAECLKAPTTGFAKFYHHNRQFDEKHCCLPCAAAECTRLGLQSIITVADAIALMKKS